jgi:hypothetical protein
VHAALEAEVKALGNPDLLTEQSYLNGLPVPRGTRKGRGTGQIIRSSIAIVLMSNHFHLLCEVPEPRTLSEAEVLERVEAGYGPTRRQVLQEELARYRRQPDGDPQVQPLLDRYRRRMYDISVFIKELKGRFAQWYNQRHDRYGVLWAERFKSVLLEGGEALAAVADCMVKA